MPPCRRAIRCRRGACTVPLGIRHNTRGAELHQASSVPTAAAQHRFSALSGSASCSAAVPTAALSAWSWQGAERDTSAPRPTRADSCQRWNCCRRSPRFPRHGGPAPATHFSSHPRLPTAPSLSGGGRIQLTPKVQAMAALHQRSVVSGSSRKLADSCCGHAGSLVSFRSGSQAVGTGGCVCV